MKIAVAVKQVATLEDEFELDGDSPAVDPGSLVWELNEWDRFSVEEALRLRDELGGDGNEVLVITVGDTEADDALLSCLAMGADRAQRIWDPGLEGAEPLTVARVLASALSRESPDLILCGVQSSDAVNGATGAALAGLLDLPRVAVVKAVEYQDGVATVERELEGGLTEVLRVTLPVLLTIQTGINEPRYANLRAIKRARDKPLDLLTLVELELSADALAAAAGSRPVRLATPDRGSGAEMLHGSPAAVAARIAEIVKERVTG